MKRIIFLFVVFCMAFCSCSKQENTSPELILKRITETNDNYSYEDYDLNFENEKCHCILKDKNSSKYLVDMRTNEANEVIKISVTADSKVDSDDFLDIVSVILKVYTTDDINNLSSSLFENTNSGQYGYFSSDKFSYSSYEDMYTRWFSVSNTRLLTTDKPELTLKANDRTTENH